MTFYCSVYILIVQTAVLSSKSESFTISPVIPNTHYILKMVSLGLLTSSLPTDTVEIMVEESECQNILFSQNRFKTTNLFSGFIINSRNVHMVCASNYLSVSLSGLSQFAVEQVYEMVDVTLISCITDECQVHLTSKELYLQMISTSLYFDSTDLHYFVIHCNSINSQTCLQL